MKKSKFASLMYWFFAIWIMELAIRFQLPIQIVVCSGVLVLLAIICGAASDKENP